MFEKRLRGYRAIGYAGKRHRWRSYGTAESRRSSTTKWPFATSTCEAISNDGEGEEARPLATEE